MEFASVISAFFNTMITLLLLVFPLSTVAYNLDVKHPIVYKLPISDNHHNRTNDSYFGFTVLLNSRNRVLSNGTIVNESWLFVGAPKADYPTSPDHKNDDIPNKPGVVYRCPLPYECASIDSAKPDDQEGFIDAMKLHTWIEKGNGWLGAAMSFDQSSDSLIVCAPRTIVRIYEAKGIDYKNTMQGFCYTVKIPDGKLMMEDKDLSSYNFTRSKFWYNPLNGFAVHYPTSKMKIVTDSIEPIIGSPKHELYGTVRKMGHRGTAELPIGDDLAQFGYSLSSGCYFHGSQLMVASGAPGWQYVGQVAIMDPRADPMAIIVTINGKEVGEYFGASLATGDINNDGLDDLIVGAPHWNNDNGRVHIFFGDKAGFYEADILLEGKVDDGVYGYALTSGDLDGDGFDDVIVGAPWEDSGVVYVYNGDANLRELGVVKPSQRIAGTDIRRDILTFGFSLARPIDINNDNFTDIAVGAYASGHAIILKSRPVVKSAMTLVTIPNILPRHSLTFVVVVCLNHSPLTGANESLWDAHVILTENEVHNPSRRYVIGFRGDPPGKCNAQKIQLRNRTPDNIRNYLDDIQIVGSHFLNYHERLDDCANGKFPMISPCPIEYKGRNATARMKLPWDIGCGIDDICQARIVTDVDFHGIENSTWTIGSDDVSLVMRIGNRAEPAYSTTVTFDLPKGINLRSIRPSCQEIGDSEFVRVTCDVGNPLKTAMEETVVLDLDMTGLRNDATDGTVLNFKVDIKTRSVNSGKSLVIIPLSLIANVSLDLSGKAYDESYYKRHNEKPTNLSFQHAYQISRFGSTSISMATLIIRIPHRSNNVEFLTMTQKPHVYVGGREFECSVIGVNVTKRRFIDDGHNGAAIENEFNLNRIENHGRSRRANFHNNFTSVTETDAAAASRSTPTDTARYNIENTGGQPQFYTISESDNVHRIYLNCSSPNVTCGRVECKIASLKTTRNVGKLQLRLVVDDSKLSGGSDSNGKIIHITTEAAIAVNDPKIKMVVPGSGIWVHVTTTLNRAPYVNNHVSIWIIVGSVLLGLLALCLIAKFLWNFGFFVRTKKNELDRLKKREDISMNSESLDEL